MLSNIFGHLKTTLSGAAIAGAEVIIHGVNWKNLLLAALMAALGALAKDPNAPTTKPSS